MFQFWIYDDLYFFTIQLFLYITWNSAIKTNFLLIANKIDFIFCSCRFNISLCRNKISVICFLSGYNCLYMYLFCISICIFIRIRPFALNIFCGSCSSIFLLVYRKKWGEEHETMENKNNISKLTKILFVALAMGMILISPYQLFNL